MRTLPEKRVQYSQTISPSGVTSKKRPCTPEQMIVCPLREAMCPRDDERVKVTPILVHPDRLGWSEWPVLRYEVTPVVFGRRYLDHGGVTPLIRLLKIMKFPAPGMPSGIHRTSCCPNICWDELSP